MVARIRSFPPAVVSYSPSNALAALIDELLQSGSFRNFCSFSLQRPRSAPTTPRPIIQKLPRVRGRNSVGKPPTSLAHAPQSFRPRHREVLKWGQVRYHLIPRPTTLNLIYHRDLSSILCRSIIENRPAGSMGPLMPGLFLTHVWGYYLIFTG